MRVRASGVPQFSRLAKAARGNLSDMKNTPIVFVVTVAVMAFAFISPPLEAATQDQWRPCVRCQTMFYNGFPNKGRCPASGRHAADSRRDVNNYVLKYDVKETPHAQAAWRFCNKCNALFFDGYAQKGACPAGDGHAAQGFMFVLPHDIGAGGPFQGFWRYCQKCHVMFFDESKTDKGRCAAGGGHSAAGYFFVLEKKSYSY